jgi:hypothetical protein
MNNLKTLHKQIILEYKRIEMLKNATSNGDYGWYDFVNEEIKKAKDKIQSLTNALNNEYSINN